jgi:hypothetical protein
MGVTLQIQTLLKVAPSFKKTFRLFNMLNSSQSPIRGHSARAGKVSATSAANTKSAYLDQDRRWCRPWRNTHTWYRGVLHFTNATRLHATSVNVVSYIKEKAKRIYQSFTPLLSWRNLKLIRTDMAFYTLIRSSNPIIGLDMPWGFQEV